MTMFSSAPPPSPSPSSPPPQSLPASVVVPVVDHVHGAFLEKEALQLWAAPALSRALVHNGILISRDAYVESLRPSFLPVLACVLSELADAFPAHFGLGHDARKFPIVRF